MARKKRPVVDPQGAEALVVLLVHVSRASQLMR